MAPRVAAMALVTCLQAMTWGCSSRTPVAAGPVQPPTDPSPDPATEVALPAEPLAPPSAVVAHETGLDDCLLTPAAGEPLAIVALNERVTPSNAPRPTNESERLLFRQLYDTLIRVDCMGRAVPGLATSWRLDADGTSWFVTLRADARFADGTPVTATDVRASWTSDGIGDMLQIAVGRMVQSLVVIDDRTLAIRLRSQGATVPLALAHPDLAVAKSGGDSVWPVGTRAARLLQSSDRPVRGGSVLTVARDNLPSVRFLVSPGDPRDLLDAGVDLLLTRDPAALDYAATLPQFQSLPLAWQRTYVLLTPGRSRSSPSLSQEARQMLADDAVRGEARGAQGPFSWETSTHCEVPAMAPISQSPPAPRIVYDADDAAARDLAERFVGLVRAASPGASGLLDSLLPDRPRRTFQRATGLTNEALALAQRLGTDAGYIVAVDSRPLDACRDVKALLETARWLDSATIVPLVETRLHALVRRGRSGVTSEWDGGLVLAGVKAPN